MKSFSTRLETIAGPVNLLHAWRFYRSGKRRRPAVARFELDAERRLLDLSDAILGGSYRHSQYRLLQIRDPKPRLIAVASVGDRVVHRSVYDVLSPGFNRSFIADSYACIPGRGSHRAILRHLELLRRYEHVMHLDIHRYFPSVAHAILLGLLAPRLRDPRIVVLLEQILASGEALYRRPEVAAFYPPDDPRRACGLPIGNLTSQWWGNLYLDGLDHFVKRQLKVPGYLRYMDDLVFFGDQPAMLRQWRRSVEEWLWDHRRLRLNPRKGHVRPARTAQRYLGHQVTRQGYELASTAIRRFRRQLPALIHGNQERMERALASWRGAMSF